MIGWVVSAATGLALVTTIWLFFGTPRSIRSELFAWWVGLSSLWIWGLSIFAWTLDIDRSHHAVLLVLSILHSGIGSARLAFGLYTSKRRGR